jgi:heptose I phosphotransferase
MDADWPHTGNADKGNRRVRSMRQARMRQKRTSLHELYNGRKGLQCRTSNAGLIMHKQNFENTTDKMFIDGDYMDTFKKAALDTLDAVFNFSQGEVLSKNNIGVHRTRIKFELEGKTFFLKRYRNTPRLVQIKNWITHRRIATTAEFDRGPTQLLNSTGISTPKTVAFGYENKNGFEQRCFIITENLYDSVSLEKQLPECFDDLTGKHRQRCEFIVQLANFVKRFHNSGLRHRDLYLSHIFLSQSGELFLIDLQRVFKPTILSERYRVKDIAQLHYSTPGDKVSCADRIRFYKSYTGSKKLTNSDKIFIKKVKAKAWRMADHDIRHSRPVPFAQ